MEENMTEQRKMLGYNAVSTKALDHRIRSTEAGITQVVPGSAMDNKHLCLRIDQFSVKECPALEVYH